METEPSTMEPESTPTSPGPDTEVEPETGSPPTEEMPSLCGDGVVSGPEECESTLATESCDADCSLPECGDGVLNMAAGETCDEAAATAECDLDCTPAACGDGVVNEAAGETCDDGEETADCDADCSAPECGDSVNNQAAGELCDGGMATDTCNADCSPAECGDGLTNTSAGETCDTAGETVNCDANCSAVACGDGQLNEAANETCDDDDRTVCDEDCTPTACGDGLLNEEAGELCDEGGLTATCDVDCTPVECGDGVINDLAGELCDDSGPSATCDSNCTLPACGDGIVNEAIAEECDDREQTASCDADCTAAECGDGTFNALSGETCDSGGATANCDDDCSEPMCGDGVVNTPAGEDCDGAGPTAECDADCTLALCGDGVINAEAGEDCDDGGPSPACDADCTLPSCGDGEANSLAGELCDSGGDSATCDADCSAPACGDGAVNTAAGEECDGEGLTTACSATCATATCPTGCYCINGNGRRYTYCDLPVTRAEAQQACAALDGNLASINDASEERWLIGHARTGNHHWISANDIDVEGEWRWSDGALFWQGVADGTVTGYALWRAANPFSTSGNEDCASLHLNPAGGEWITRTCSVTYGYLCETVPAAKATCGDGAVDSGEACDDAAATASCDADCTLSACGDGILNSASGELCDDGNADPYDTCDDNCQDTGLLAYWTGNHANAAYQRNIASSFDLRANGGLTFVDTDVGTTFDGIDDFLDIRQAGNPDLLNFGGNITLTAAVSLGAAPAAFVPVVVHGASATGARVYLGVNATNIVGGVADGAGATAEVSGSAATWFGSGTWHHLALSYDGSAWVLYLDGVNVDTTSSALGSITVAANWSIGGFAATTPSYAGGIAQVRIYGRALSPAEIAGIAALAP